MNLKNSNTHLCWKDNNVDEVPDIDLISSRAMLYIHAVAAAEG